MENEGITYLIIFAAFIWWIIKPTSKPENTQQATRPGDGGKDHLRYITTREIFKQKTGRFPNMNNESDAITFIKIYNSEGKQQPEQRAGGYYPQPYPQPGPYQPGPWR